MLSEFLSTDGTDITTYVAAAIGVQKGWKRDFFSNNNPFRGEGWALLTDNQMNTSRGGVAPCQNDSAKDCGPGLGLFGQDQNDPNVAIAGMRVRITLTTDYCASKNCGSTDIFVAAALAGNGPGFKRDNMKSLPSGGATRFDWVVATEGNSYNNSYNRKLIREFATDVIYLEKQGWYAPNDIDWKYVYSLIKQPPIR